MFTLGNVCAVAATCFLVGPARQWRNMITRERIFSALAFVGSMILTLLACIFVRSWPALMHAQRAQHGAVVPQRLPVQCCYSPALDGAMCWRPLCARRLLMPPCVTVGSSATQTRQHGVQSVLTLCMAQSCAIVHLSVLDGAMRQRLQPLCTY